MDFFSLAVGATPVLLVGILFAIPILARRARVHREDVAARLLGEVEGLLRSAGLLPAEGLDLATVRDLGPISRPRAKALPRPPWLCAALEDDAALLPAEERARLAMLLGSRAYAPLPELLAHVGARVEEGPTGEWPVHEMPLSRCYVLGTEPRHRPYRDLVALYVVASALLRDSGEEHSTADRWLLAEHLHRMRQRAL